MLQKLELPKIALTLILTGCFVYVSMLTADFIFTTETPQYPLFPESVASTDATASGVPVVVIASLANRLVSADANKGQTVAKKCLACHTFTEGGKSLVAPNLYNIVSRDVASIQGFAYSNAMKAKEGIWSYEELDKYLTDPKGYIPGNKMAFAGVPKLDERANLLSYLQSLSPAPVAFPQDVPTPAPVETVPIKAESAPEVSPEVVPAAPVKEAPPTAPVETAPVELKKSEPDPTTPIKGQPHDIPDENAQEPISEEQPAQEPINKGDLSPVENNPLPSTQLTGADPITEDTYAKKSITTTFVDAKRNRLTVSLAEENIDSTYAIGTTKGKNTYSKVQNQKPSFRNLPKKRNLSHNSYYLSPGEQFYHSQGNIMVRVSRH